MIAAGSPANGCPAGCCRHRAFKNKSDMKTISFEQAGEPLDVLSVKDQDIPAPGRQEVRIRILGSTINPADSLFIRGHYRFKPVFPQVAGMEAAGIIDEVGEGVTLPKGALAAFLYKGAWAGYVIVPAEEIYILPAGFPVEKAIQFVLNPFTAWGLLEEAGVAAGDWVLITAATSAVARILTQIARRRGIRVISVVRNRKYEERLKALGADAVVDVSEKDWVQQIGAVTEGKGVQAAIDAIGGETGTALLSTIAPNGRLILYGLLSPDNISFHYSAVIYKQLTIKGFGIRNFITRLTPEARQEMVASLIGMIGDPAFKLEVSAAYPPAQFREAFHAAMAHAGDGKTIFKF